MTTRARFEAALAAATERVAQAKGQDWTGVARVVEALEALANPRTVMPADPVAGPPLRAYAFLGNLRVEQGVALAGVPFWASEWLDTTELPDALTAIDGIRHVRPLADAQVAVCATCGDPTYAVSEEYTVSLGGVVSAVLTLCLRCPELAEHARAGRSCWSVDVVPDPGPQDEHELLAAVRRGFENDQFACLVRGLGTGWRAPADTQRAYALRREPGERCPKFWPLELCDLPVLARLLARSGSWRGEQLGTFDDIARPTCERCGSLAYGLGEDVGPDWGGLNYDVYDHDVCAQCRHISTRAVRLGVQYPDR